MVENVLELIKYELHYLNTLGFQFFRYYSYCHLHNNVVKTIDIEALVLPFCVL
jgi:hypothetical protein